VDSLEGKDRVCGGDGRDTLRGGPHGDLLDGQGANDRLVGAGGPDRLKGGPGKDVLAGGKARDRLAEPGQEAGQRLGGPLGAGGDAETVAAGQAGADAWTEHEAQADRRADETQCPGALLLRREIGRVRLTDRDRTAEGTRDHARPQQQDQRSGEPSQRERHHRTHETQQEQSSSAVPVRKGTEHRRRHELSRRVRREQRADPYARAAEHLRVEGQHRQDDAEAQHVYKHGQAYHEQSGTVQRRTSHRVARTRVDITPLLHDQQGPDDNHGGWDASGSRCVPGLAGTAGIPVIGISSWRR